MKDERFKSEDPLASILKAADPAGEDPGLSRAESARMKLSLPETRQLPSPWVPVVAGGSLVAVALVVLLAVWSPGVRLVPPSREITPAQAGNGTPGGRAPARDMKSPRTIHFETAGGTRVIWSLDPDFDV
jgi:hypothetical protein